MAALAFWFHYNVSKTDAPCRWNQPKTSEATGIHTAEDIFKKGNKEYKPLKQTIDDSAVANLLDNLRLQAPTGMQWLLEPHIINKSEEDLIPNIENILFCKDYFMSKNKKGYLLEKTAISSEISEKINCLTIGQSGNPLWFLARKHRLTASNFGLIIKACGRNRFPQSLFKQLGGKYYG